MSVKFTQYMRPNGFQKDIKIDMDDVTEAMARTLLDAGCRFDAEVLTTGVVSLTCERGDECLSHELCANDETVVEAVRKVVANAFTKVEAKNA